MRTISQRKVFPVNNNKRLLLQSALALAAAATFSSGAMAQDKPIKVGVTGGPHAQIFEQVKKVAEKDGLKIQIVEFSDYVQPNAALAAGDLDVNSYQHQPYLDNTNKDRGYKLVSIGQTIIFPIGLYSKKFKSLDQIPNAVATNYSKLLGWTRGNFWRWVLNSLIYSGVSALIGTIVSVMAGYATAKFNFRGKAIAIGVVMVIGTLLVIRSVQSRKAA